MIAGCGWTLLAQVSLTYARFLEPEVTGESQVTPGLRKNGVLETSNPGVNLVTGQQLTRHRRQGNPQVNFTASKMATHFDDDIDVSIISSAAYSY